MIVASHSISDISDTLSHALAFAHQWLLTSGLHLNVSNTKCMLIHSNPWKPQASLEVQLAGISIEQVWSCKCLGVMINDILTWSDHVNLFCTKASKEMNLLRRICSLVPTKTSPIML